MPAYTLGGKIVLITAAFKAHAALNFWRGQELESTPFVGRRHGPVRQDQVARRPACRRRTRSPDPRSRGPGDKRAGAAQDQARAQAAAGAAPGFRRRAGQGAAAKAALDGFPPSAQRDYFEWIAEAKQDATRHKRIATAIEWLQRRQAPALEISESADWRSFTFVILMPGPNARLRPLPPPKIRNSRRSAAPAGSRSTLSASPRWRAS